MGCGGLQQPKSVQSAGVVAGLTCPSGISASAENSGILVLCIACCISDSDSWDGVVLFAALVPVLAPSVRYSTVSLCCAAADSCSESSRSRSGALASCLFLDKRLGLIFVHRSGVRRVQNRHEFRLQKHTRTSHVTGTWTSLCQRT